MLFWKSGKICLGTIQFQSGAAQTDVNISGSLPELWFNDLNNF